MIDLYTWPTPNGIKITIALEELGLPYRVFPIDITKNEQFAPAFLAVSPNNKIPAIVDHDAAGGPLSLFESGAILIYLAEKTGKLMPADARGRADVLQWLFWQVGGLGPMAGQAHHFRKFAKEKIPYAIDRYTAEVARLYGVIDKRLADREYLAGDYSIADIACWGWIARYEWQGQDLASFPHLQAWFERVGARPAVARGKDIGRERRG